MFKNTQINIQYNQKEPFATPSLPGLGIDRT